MESVQARVVEPVLDHAALENARLVNRARAQLLRSGTAVTVQAIADSLGKTADTVRRWAARQRRAGRLVTVTHDGQVLIPSVQLDEALDVDDAAADLVGRCVAYGMDGWAVWHWFETPNTWLEGDTPARHLRAGDIDAVHRALSGMFQE